MNKHCLICNAINETEDDFCYNCGSSTYKARNEFFDRLTDEQLLMVEDIKNSIIKQIREMPEFRQIKQLEQKVRIFILHANQLLAGNLNDLKDFLQEAHQLSMIVDKLNKTIHENKSKTDQLENQLNNYKFKVKNNSTAIGGLGLVFGIPLIIVFIFLNQFILIIITSILVFIAFVLGFKEMDRNKNRVVELEKELAPFKMDLDKQIENILDNKNE